MVSSSAYEELPCELKTCILSRLAVKDLLRLRRVSKAWCALIEDPFFVKNHLQRAIDESENSNDPSVLLTRVRQPFKATRNLFKANFLVGSEECETELMEYRTFHSIDRIIGACDGLLCVIRNYFGEIVISIWNISTGESHDLRDKPNGFQGLTLDNVYGFGYDRVSDDYKVIHINCSHCSSIKTEITIYSLKTKSWTLISSKGPVPCNCREKMIFGEKNDGTFARSTNSIYWVFTEEKNPNRFLIGRFVLGDGNRYLEVEQPNYNNNNDKISHISIGALGGCLCLSSRNLSSNDVWVMKEDSKSWTKLISFSSNSLVGHGSRAMIPVAYSRSGNKILCKELSYRCMSKLSWYDLKTKKDNYQSLLCDRVVVMTESLVRINNGIRF